MSVSSLDKMLVSNSPCRTDYLVVKCFIEKLLKIQPPQNAQVISTEKAYYDDHGISHIERVILKLDKLHELINMNEREASLLLIAAYCHDLGMFCGRRKGESPDVTRTEHHLRSAQAFQDFNDKRFHFDIARADPIKRIISAHRVIDLHDLPEEQRIEGNVIRTRLLGSFLRIADACDCDHSRTPEAIFDAYYSHIPEKSRKYWQKLLCVTSVDFDTQRSAIVVSITIDGSLTEKVATYRSGNIVRQNLLRELHSVTEVFRKYGVPLTTVNIMNFGSGKYIDPSYPPIYARYFLISLKAWSTRIDSLTKTLSSFVSNDGFPLIIELRHPEGPLFFDSDIKLDGTKVGELTDSLRESLDDQFEGLLLIGAEREVIMTAANSK